MHKAWLVAKREYIENLTTKTFWIGILAFPFLITLSVLVPVLLEKEKDARSFLVIDHSQWLFKEVLKQASRRDFTRLMGLQNPPDELLSALGMNSFKDVDSDSREHLAEMLANRDDTLDTGKITTFYQWWDALSRKEAKALHEGLSKARFILIENRVETDPRKLIRSKKLFACFEIAEEPLKNDAEIAYISNNLTDDSLKNWFSHYAEEIIQQHRFELNNIDYTLAQSIIKPIQFREIQINESGKEEHVQTKDTIRQWVPVAFVYLLWIAVFSIAQMLLTNTVEEKSNRIIEVLLSSISPLELMGGKVLGIAATGLTVVLSWVLTLFAALKIVPTMIMSQLTLNLASIVGDPFFLTSFVVYFLLGYLLYAAILVAMGSICNTLKEAQNLMSPVTILLMIPLLSMMPIGRDPNGTLAQIMSFIPLFTPFVMMNRAAGPPELWEYIATTTLLIASIIFAFWIAAKIFRVGILMTGKPPRLKEIWQWVKMPVNTSQRDVSSPED